MWEKVFWRTTSSSQQPCAMEALCGRPMFLTESGGYVCMYVFQKTLNMYENSDKFVLNRKSRFSHFEVCCSYTFIRKPERFPTDILM
jgi:hypothetical protein